MYSFANSTGYVYASPAFQGSALAPARHAAVLPTATLPIGRSLLGVSITRIFPLYIKLKIAFARWILYNFYLQAGKNEKINTVNFLEASMKSLNVI